MVTAGETGAVLATPTTWTTTRHRGATASPSRGGSRPLIPSLFPYCCSLCASVSDLPVHKLGSSAPAQDVLNALMLRLPAGLTHTFIKLRTLHQEVQMLHQRVNTQVPLADMMSNFTMGLSGKPWSYQAPRGDLHMPESNLRRPFGPSSRGSGGSDVPRLRTL